ncbi:hypothetical protein [Chryseobacterium defluvii]|uniref:Heat induced stress protein YflT n=1 Tax=Chryseobacterium defluvii TaxID=160396 RepID=A0A495SBU9_9FLAO|nr:hypothetical protein [Chryseobacterium defluvii]RKS96764.1 hypothetical protein BCF58_3199 [Chryseobacterium defluvii]
MAYTVISVFPATVDTEEIKEDLTNQGFDRANIIVSKSRLENRSPDGHYEEDVKTRSFWDYIFAHDTEMLEAYKKESVGKNNIIVYTDTAEDAQKAKAILDKKGAIEVYRKQPESNVPEGMSEETYNGIIAKARHNLYFLDSERVYKSGSKGMDEPMDSQGSED